MRSQCPVALALVVLLCLQLYEGVCLVCTPATPSHGDLRLLVIDNDDYALVQLYMGPDGANELWGTLNGYILTGSVGDTLCHQLSYDKGEMVFRPPNPSISQYLVHGVWLSDINCSENHSRKHILRCKYSFVGGTEPDHSHDIHLKCSFPLVKNPGLAYSGQGTLYPPSYDGKCYGSRSYGAVIFQHDGMWKYIRKSALSSMLTLDDTDTICREIGFTHSVPNSLMTVGQSNAHDYDFSRFGHIDSEDFQCSESCACIGCCYNLSISKPPSLEPTTDGDALILRCSFYSPLHSPPVAGGYEEICYVGNNGAFYNESACPSSESLLCESGAHHRLKEREFLAAIVAPVGFIILIIIATIVGILLYRARRVRNRRRAGYAHVDRGGGDGRNGGQVGNGGNGGGGQVGNGGNGGGGQVGNGGNGGRGQVGNEGN